MTTRLFGDLRGRIRRDGRADGRRRRCGWWRADRCEYSGDSLEAMRTLSANVAARLTTTSDAASSALVAHADAIVARMNASTDDLGADDAWLGDSVAERLVETSREVSAALGAQSADIVSRIGANSAEAVDAIRSQGEGVAAQLVRMFPRKLLRGACRARAGRRRRRHCAVERAAVERDPSKRSVAGLAPGPRSSLAMTGSLGPTPTVWSIGSATPNAATLEAISAPTGRIRGGAARRARRSPPPGALAGHSARRREPHFLDRPRPRSRPSRSQGDHVA